MMALRKRKRQDDGTTAYGVVFVSKEIFRFLCLRIRGMHVGCGWMRRGVLRLICGAMQRPQRGQMDRDWQCSVTALNSNEALRDRRQPYIFS